MKTYRVVVVKRAQKEVQRLPTRDKKRVVGAILSLCSDPFRGKKLQGEHEGKWSFRVWPYRIIYTIDRTIVTVTVLRVGNRQGIYTK